MNFILCLWEYQCSKQRELRPGVNKPRQEENILCCVGLVAVENFNFIEIVFQSKGNLWQKIFLILKVVTHKYWGLAKTFTNFVTGKLCMRGKSPRTQKVTLGKCLLLRRRIIAMFSN